MVEIVPTFPIVVGYLVDFGDENTERAARRHVILAVEEDTAFHFLSDFY